MAGLTRLAQFWLLLTAPVVLIDAVFVLTRAASPDEPHPLANTPPFSFWELYATYDRRYGPNDDAFVVVQSWLNLLEIVLGVFSVVLTWKGDACRSVKLALIVSVMTAYKTVLYLALDVAEGGKYTRHNTALDMLTMVLLPSSLWIAVPTVVALQCLRRLSATAGRGATPSLKKAKRG
ncbi:hypothetical protein DQ04_02451020 [Trypanosoma grayi]|uniref:hypothetical protein n=1 Tax=Trypanosoma grayi TaxID=71804 RepID=UPI0004F470B9|nr:hypothetical protein DQ04_02451020 [Trypanosoma grayi]KEG11600.1 hypothetical protein DQ04_02451020 [Trypanosoma grayi]